MRVPWQKVLPGWCPTANSGECMFFPLRGKLRYGRGAKSRGKPAPNQRAANLRQKGPPNDKAAKGPQKRATQSRGCERGAKRGAQSKGLRPCHVIRRQKDAQSEGFRQLGYGLYSGKFSVSYSRRMLDKKKSI